MANSRPGWHNLKKNFINTPTLILLRANCKLFLRSPGSTMIDPLNSFSFINGLRLLRLLNPNRPWKLNLKIWDREREKAKAMREKAKLMMPEKTFPSFFRTQELVVKQGRGGKGRKSICFMAGNCSISACKSSQSPSSSSPAETEFSGVLESAGEVGIKVTCRPHFLSATSSLETNKQFQ